jgi:dienelactone hydrolase
MRSRALIVALGIAAVAIALAPRPRALGKPGITPVPCPQQEWQLGDASFEALPNAKAFAGRYDGGLYRIEIPERWNGELVLYAHGYVPAGGASGSTLRVGNHPIRQHLVDQGFAWASSSYRCNGYVPGQGLVDTMALVELFTKSNGGRAPNRTYLTGTSMGGHVTVLGLHEFPTSFAGGLAMCAAGPELFDFFAGVGAAAETIAGVQFKASEIQEDNARIADVVGKPPEYTDKGRELANVEIDISGGPRPFAAEGLASGGRFLGNISGGALAGVDTPQNRAVDTTRIAYPGDLNTRVRRKPGDAVYRSSNTPLEEVAPFDGKIERPLLTMHGTGDLFVPIFLEQTLKRAVTAAGKDALLVQRIYRIAGHCGFNQVEQIQAFDDLVKWVRDGVKPAGDNVDGNLRDAGRTFTNPLRDGDPGGLQVTTTPAGKVDFVRDVQPILRQQCYSCHGPVVHQMGLRLDRRADALRGGSISVIGPGNASGSRLYLRVAGASPLGPQMPPTGALSPLQIDILKHWIDEGAEWPDAAAGDAAPQPIPPLLIATAAGDVSRVRALLDAGADVNVKSDEGRTPLLVASGLRGAAPLVRLLLDRGATAKVEALGWTPLLEAVYTGDEEVQRMVVAAGETRVMGVAVGLALQTGCRTCAEFLATHLDADAVAQGLNTLTPPEADGRNLDAYLALVRARNLPTDVKPTRRSIAQGPEDVDIGTPSPAPSPRAAVERSIPLLQAADVTFMKKSGCVSCHNNSLTSMAVSIARSHGVRVDEEIAQSQVDAVGRYLESWRNRVSLGSGIPGDHDTISYLLLGLSAEGFGATPATETMARFLVRMQRPDGRWPINAERPPIESSDIEVTAVSLRALQVYAPKGETASSSAIKAGGAWLAHAQPRSTEDRAFLLLGLGWTHAPKATIQKTARALLAEQRPDGGWSQLPSLASDAYATGQALVALEQSGSIEPTAPAYRRGVEFLLKSQFADGSWIVHTRALPIQPYFESGFPHRRDQFISNAATGWATIALAAVVR